MNKQTNFEDTIFILNVRIRMIRDLLRLDTDAGLFIRQTIEDMEFIGSVMEVLVDKLLANPGFLDREFDNLSDTEWQFSNLLAEFSSDSGPFSSARFPETITWISKLREESEKRQKLVNEAYAPSGRDNSEPVVSQAELSELLKGA